MIPSLVQMPSGEKYRWRTDRSGGLTFLKTPVGGVHHFTQYGLLDRICRQRTAPFVNSSSYVTCLDDDGQLLEYHTPDGLHSLSYKRDAFGRTIQISADAENINLQYRMDGGSLEVCIFCLLGIIGLHLLWSRYRTLYHPKDRSDFHVELTMLLKNPDLS